MKEDVCKEGYFTGISELALVFVNHEKRIRGRGVSHEPASKSGS
jgi:hypothetical protein